MIKTITTAASLFICLLNIGYAQQITSISPTEIIGGKGDVLTITGSGFGASRGSSFVSFYTEQSTYTDASTSNSFSYISWNDSEITLQMPVAFSNKVKVVKDGNEIESADILKVMANLSYREVNPLVYNLLIDKNGAGGITWYVHPAFWDNLEIREAIAAVVKEFRCKTGVNYVIERLNDEVPLSLAEGIHIIAPDENLDVVGYNAKRWSSCILGSETFYYYKTQLLQFDTDVTWYYGTGQAPAGATKFRYVLFHEMGHSLGLGHVNEEGQSMYPTVNFSPSDNWSARDVITTAEETAIQHFVSLSQNFTFRACSINPLLAIGNCEDVYGEKADLAERLVVTELVVYPNPTFGVANIRAPIDQIGTSYTVYSSTGTEMLTGKITARETEVELQNLAAGMYFIQIGNNPKQTYRVMRR